MLTPAITLQFLNSGCILTSSFQDVILGWGDPVRAARSQPHQLSVYAPDFFLKDPQPWWIFSQHLRVSRDELRESLQASLSQVSAGSAKNHGLQTDEGHDWTGPDFDYFKSTFLDLQKFFQRGALRKAVPVVFERTRLEMGALSKASLLAALLGNTQDLPVSPYGLWDQEQGILGATPELLFRRDPDLVFHTVALAGTRLKGSARLPILEDPKEREEHQMVIEGICASLSPLGPVVPGQTRELVLPSFSHLLTPIEFRTDLDFEKIVQALHPTPALGAFPKAEGMHWLEFHPQAPERYRFGAPFGGVVPGGSAGPDGEIQCWVAIRNIQWVGSRVLLGAGCGVIPASELEREWLELQAKIQSVKQWFI